MYAYSELHETERPTARIAEYGGTALAQHELLAALIGGPRQIEAAFDLLKAFPTLRDLRAAQACQIEDIPGIGPAAAARILAAVEIGRRSIHEGQKERPTINSPSDAAALIQWELSAFEQEHLRVLYLTTRNHVIGWEDVYKGSLNQSQVRVGEIFRGAIRHNAASIIVAHNHPSGDPTPSPDDVAITRAIIEAGRLLDVEVLDHLIIGHGRFISLKERRLGFE